MNDPNARIADLRSALQAAARQPVESIDPRLDGLEAELLRSIEADDRRGVVVLPVGVAHRRLALRVAGGLASAACIIGIVIVSLGWFGRAEPDVAISSADDVSVVLPDGSVVAGVEGLVLPDGARLDVDGSLVVGGQNFGPGDYVVGPDGITPVGGSPGGGVANGTTTTSEPGSTSIATAPRTTTRSSAPGGDRPARTVAPVTTVRDRPSRPSTTVRSTQPPRTAPEGTRPRDTTSDSTRPPPTTEPTRPTTTTTSPARPTTSTSTTSSTMPRPTTTAGSRDVVSGSDRDRLIGGD